MRKRAVLGTRITEDTIATLRGLTDIVQVVSERITLKRSGRRFVGLCPFHMEKSPSFSVDPERQMYHCFGCGAGGDVFSFVMQTESIAFPDAVKSLADRHGFVLEGHQDEDGSKSREREAILEANRVAFGVFRHGLLKSPLGESARQYLEKRGISRAFMDEFGLGFIPDGWSYLADYMGKKGFSLPELEQAGLVIRNQQGRFYDRFRNRILFPIQDVQGRIIGFGGRVLGNENPKYLNSPETPVYHKARSLYGLHQARHAIRKSRVVHVVEGYFDVISLHQHGVRDTVAGLGTALTREQLQLLRGYADRVVLVFDGDAAGFRAAERAAPLLLSMNMDARVFLLPEGEDPDTLVRRSGRELFLEGALQAEPLFSFLVRTSLQRWGREPSGRIKTLESLLPLFEGIGDAITRDVYLRELADALDMDGNAVRERLGKRPLLREENGEKPARVSDSLRMEEALVSLLLSFPQSRERLSELNPENFFSDPVLKRIVLSIFKNRDVKDSWLNDPDILEDPEIQRRLSGLHFQKSPWNAENADLLISQFLRLRQQAHGNSGLMDRIKAAEAGKDQARLMALLEQKQEQARKAAKIGLSRMATPRRHTQ